MIKAKTSLDDIQAESSVIARGRHWLKITGNLWGLDHNKICRPKFPSHAQPSQGGSPWWRHQMKTFSALLALCAGNSPVPVNSPHKGQLRGALMFSLMCVWINGWVNNREAGDLRRHRGHYDVNVMNAWNGPACELDLQRTDILVMWPKTRGRSRFAERIMTEQPCHYRRNQK